jgi:calcineurin-like phosphoesterase family protein
MNLYFTADWHINHANILKYCGRTLFMNNTELAIYNKLKNRPQNEQKEFKISKESLIKMNETLIKRCNERVKENDQLFFIGDFGFKSGTDRGEGEPEKLQKYIDQINCKHITMIEGNHDKSGKNSIRTPIQKIVIKYGGKRINLVHDPEFADINYEINLTAHVHQKWEIKRYRKGMSFTDCINCGVDVWNFYPVDWSEIWQRYSLYLKKLK